MDSKVLEKLEETVLDEIQKVTKKSDLTPAELDSMTKAVCLLEKISEIKSNEEFGDSYTSGSRYHSMRPSSMMPRRRIYDSGRSGHSIKDRMIAKLEEMYDEANSEHERSIVDEWINRLGSDGGQIGR